MSTVRPAPSKKSMTRAWVGFTIIGSCGLIVAVVLTIVEGVKYRIREDQGLGPIYAPEWVAVSTYAGLGVFVLALVGLVVTGIVALIRR
jgi:preprotein translocase subunit Sss1